MAENRPVELHLKQNGPFPMLMEWAGGCNIKCVNGQNLEECL